MSDRGRDVDGDLRGAPGLRRRLVLITGGLGGLGTTTGAGPSSAGARKDAGARGVARKFRRGTPGVASWSELEPTFLWSTQADVAVRQLRAALDQARQRGPGRRLSRRMVLDDARAFVRLEPSGWAGGWPPRARVPGICITWTAGDPSSTSF